MLSASNRFNLFYFKNSIYLNFVKNLNAKTLRKSVKHIQIGKNEEKVPDYIKKYFKSKEEFKIVKKFPYKFLRRKPSPKSLYIAHTNAGKIINEHLKSKINKGDTILEVNPGVGILTKELIKSNASKIILIEAYDEFVRNLKLEYEQINERVKIKHGDAINLWKLAFRDKIDQGKRVEELLTDVPQKEFNDDPNMKFFACVGSLNFFKHLIMSIIFGRSIYSFGRCEMFLVLPPPVYIHLTCSSEAGYLIYRTNSILFQIMFEYQFITKLPRQYFVPWAYEEDLSNYKKLGKIKSIDPELLYLIRIIPRKNLHDLCSQDNMQALWYFVQQSCLSRKNRVIPNLEKWIPGCGARLIVNTSKRQEAKQLFPSDDIEKLPKYCKPCITITGQDYYPSMDIFSEFGDLTPSQIFTLFCFFRSLPQYKESSFLASLDNSLLKFESSVDSDISEIIDDEKDEKDEKIDENT